MGERDDVSWLVRANRTEARYDAVCKRMLFEKAVLAWILRECTDECRGLDVSKIARGCIGERLFDTAVAGLSDDAGDAGEGLNSGEAPRIYGLRNEDTRVQEGSVFYDMLFRVDVPVRDGTHVVGMAGAPGIADGVSRESPRLPGTFPRSGPFASLLVNVEAQADFYPGYPIMARAQYYCARLLSAQHGVEFTKSHYERLKRVYSIWICTDPPQRMRGRLIRWPLGWPARAEGPMPGWLAEVVEMGGEWFFDLMRVAIVCTDVPGTPGLAGFLGTLLTPGLDPVERSELLRTRYNVDIEADVGGEGSAMGKFISERLKSEWRDEGLREGREEGKALGLEEGRAEGRAVGRAEGRSAGKLEALVSSVRNLMRNAGLPLDQAMDMLGISEADRGPCAELVAGQSAL